jgi:hypothetical protein
MPENQVFSVFVRWINKSTKKKKEKKKKKNESKKKKKSTNTKIQG